MDKRLFKARIEEFSEQQTAANFEGYLNTIKNPAKSLSLSWVTFSIRTIDLWVCTRRLPK